MLTFRNTNIVFGGLLVLLIILHLYLGIPGYSYFLLLLLYSLLLFRGSYRIDSNFYFDIVCSAKTHKKQIALSFDDGPLPEYTPQILAILKEHQVPAAFFCIGHRVKLYPELFQMVVAQGHLIGNHSYSHAVWFDFFSAQKMLTDLQQTDQVMEKIAGIKPVFFRPPYGVTNPNLKKAVMNGNYIPVGWNIRSMDTVSRDGERLLKKVTAQLQPGAIILFHDTAKVTPGMLSAFIRHAVAEGYEIVRLDKLLNLKPYV